MTRMYYMLLLRTTSEGYCCSRYGDGSGPVWLQNVHCLGNESKIEECSHNGWSNRSNYHWGDFSIDCLPNTSKNILFTVFIQLVLLCLSMIPRSVMLTSCC